MLYLNQSKNAWGSANFNQVFKHEIAMLNHTSLPLQQGLTQSSYVSDEPVSAVILNAAINNSLIQIRAGIFYTGIIAGCSCADDPTPQDTQNEYCELLFAIQLDTGATEVSLLSE